MVQRHRRVPIELAAFVTLVLTVIAGCQSSQQSAPSSQPPQTAHHPRPPQVELPFTGLNGPTGVAVETKGNVYVTDDSNNRVLKLPAGTNNEVELPLMVRVPMGVAVDTAGDVYVTDGGNGRVLKLSAWSTTQVELPFDLKGIPGGLTVDTAGNVYVAGGHSVWKLPAGSNTPSRLPFADLKSPTGVAVDTAGNIYVTDGLDKDNKPGA